MVEHGCGGGARLEQRAGGEALVRGARVRLDKEVHVAHATEAAADARPSPSRRPSLYMLHAFCVQRPLELARRPIEVWYGDHEQPPVAPATMYIEKG